MAKCLYIRHTDDGNHSPIRNPLALSYISHISIGEHPRKFTVMGITEREACRDAQGQKQHMVLWHASLPPRAHAFQIAEGGVAIKDE